MVDKYLKLKEQEKILVWLLIFGVIGFVGLCPVFFFYQAKGYSYPLGWLLGTIAEIIGWWSIMKMGDALLPESGDPKDRRNPILFVVLRFAIYFVVLVIAAICTFKSEWFGGFDAFSFWTTFVALLPAQIITLVRSSKNRIK